MVLVELLIRWVPDPSFANLTVFSVKFDIEAATYLNSKPLKRVAIGYAL